ncbi:MAG: site-specific DNA-methyltransferase [Phascolarctobacterium sp.]|uniref:site-specific DNA-methyltransferase n=1 Tax=Phascolarctobacterium sp. TaxID=2049039 RepID=UPI0026DAF1A7|nr:site-specific DNA-methyltransferase [Phascolarctobacterium sp.]MDO4922337.1 site-specific DNA-methyltransferase [Phascolarctobacterium sp.]
MSESEQLSFEFAQRPTIKGYPELRWTGKRPYLSTQYYPAQLRETYGEATNGWVNKIFWGDNLQVMSHLLKEYRGKIDLIYIDPPFDSKADYKKKIDLKGIGKAESDSSSFEEKQYGDIWTNDEYLQFMYERLILMKELLSEKGSIFLHCDWHKSSYLRCLMDDIFGQNCFRNEIIWHYADNFQGNVRGFATNHNNIFWYSKGQKFTSNPIMIPLDKPTKRDKRIWSSELGKLVSARNPDGSLIYEIFTEKKADDVWEVGQSSTTKSASKEFLGYPTQKPEKLLERIIKAASNSDDLVFDCFMGSGTTQAVAMKLGRRFIGADINLGAIQTTTKRLLSVASELESKIQDEPKYTGFEVYNVNNYDFFRNPVEAHDLLIAALEIQPFPQSNVWDGELDGRMVKIMPVNRIAIKADLKELLANLPYKTYEKRKEESPHQPVERMTIVCMGHEPDLKGALEQELSDYKVDVEVLDILRDKADLQLKRESEAEIVREGDELVIREFYPLNLMQKLYLQKEYVEDWRQLVDSIMIDWNYDGVVMQPAVIDIPGKNAMVSGVYAIPENAGTIKVKITDLLSESLEMEVR